MADKILVPASGELGEEIVLISWHKQEGDPVRQGDPVAEIEAQKGVLEIEAPASGRLIARLVSEGDSIGPGEVIGYIGQPGEAIESGNQRPKLGAVRIMPGARRLAEEMGITLSSIRGTGPQNTITVSDVEAYGGGERPGGKAAPAGFSKNQAWVARTVTAGHREIPAIHLVCEVDMTRAQRVKKQGIRYDALFIKAAAVALSAYPRFTWIIDGHEPRVTSPEGIGYAVAIEDDLFTPVVRGAMEKTLKEVDTSLDDLISRLSEGTVSAGELKGFTVLLSNLGMYGITAFDAIIPPAACAAIAFGSIRKVPFVLEDSLVVRPVMTVTLTVDHRIINGTYAARFLADLKTRVETPEGEVR